MPVLCRFKGVIIRMYFQQTEHNPPHFHAFYGEDAAAFSIMNGMVLDGYLPPKIEAEVKEWGESHRAELLHIWETQEFKALEPLT